MKSNHSTEVIGDSIELPTVSGLAHSIPSSKSTSPSPTKPANGNGNGDRPSSDFLEMGLPIESSITPALSPVVSRRSSDGHALYGTGAAAASLGFGIGDEESVRDRNVIAREAGETDPLLLRGRIVDDGQMNELRNRHGKRKDGKKIAQFYQDQNEQIERMLKPLHAHTADAAEQEAANRSSVVWAIRLSFFANIILAVLQLYAAVSSLSLSLFATAIDAVFDPFANILLNVLHKRSKNVDEKKWPMGGSRFESIGNIVYGALMGMVNLILIVESIRSIATHKSGDTTNLHIPSLIAVGIAFLTKFALFIFCFSIRKQSSQVQVLFEDHRNDLFVNGFGIFTSAAGAKIIWWLDPMGAMIIATCIILSWTKTVYEQFTLLAGKAAPVDYQQLVIYKALTFHEEIKAIDTVSRLAGEPPDAFPVSPSDQQHVLNTSNDLRPQPQPPFTHALLALSSLLTSSVPTLPLIQCRVYHSGPEYFVELDVIMDAEMPLWKAHDIAQDLQDQVRVRSLREKRRTERGLILP